VDWISVLLDKNVGVELDQRHQSKILQNEANRNRISLNARRPLKRIGSAPCWSKSLFMIVASIIRSIHLLKNMCEF
jgi:hypothetical protein